MIHNEHEELEQMREQLQLLKEKLAREHIVNDRVMRRAVRDKISGVQQRSVAMSIFGTFAIPFVIVTLLMTGFSTCYVVMTGAFLIISVITELYTMMMLRSRDLRSGNLLSAGIQAARVKRLQQRWLIIGLLFVAVWLSWGAYELHTLFPNAEEFHAMLISGAVGGVIGGVIGGVVYRRNQRELSEIIDQIEDLIEGEEE
ncbi:MAG: hypothetical protein E7133_05330 [Rikenellaceae bacterium]|nr:hypothetical protein [Rikenellaceae bacterium]